MSKPKIHPLFDRCLTWLIPNDAVGRAAWKDWINAGKPLVDETHQTSYVIVKKGETNQDALFRRIAELENELVKANDEATWAKGALVRLREDLAEIFEERKAIL